MINPITKDLLEHNPHVDKIIPINKDDYNGLSGKLRLSNLIRKENFDVSIFLNPNVPFLVASFWGLVPIRLTIIPNFCTSTFKFASFFVTNFERHLPGRQVLETYLKLLEKIDIKNPSNSKEVYKSNKADEIAQRIIGDIKKPLIGIAITSGKKLKEMGPFKVAEIVNQILSKMDIYAVFVGSVDDINIFKTTLNLIDQKSRVIDAVGKLNLKELPALIERFSLFIGVDTGIVYMADALSVPVINIAGPANMDDQGPSGKDSIIIKKNIDCSPCSHVFKTPSTCINETRECIESVSSEEVFTAANSILFHNRL